MGLVLRRRVPDGWVPCGGLASAGSRHGQGNWGRRILEVLRCRGGAAPGCRSRPGLPGRGTRFDGRNDQVGFCRLGRRRAPRHAYPGHKGRRTHSVLVEAGLPVDAKRSPVLILGRLAGPGLCQEWFSYLFGTGVVECR